MIDRLESDLQERISDISRVLAATDWILDILRGEETALLGTQDPSAQILRAEGLRFFSHLASYRARLKRGHVS